MDSAKRPRLRRGSKNFSTVCRFIGCKNNNHVGFRVDTFGNSTACRWIEWLEKDGIEIDIKKVKSIKICFRHFRQEDMRLTGGITNRVALKRLSIPVYRPGDTKDAQDEAYHEILNKLYENKLKLWEDEIYQKRWGVKRKSPSKEERGENEEVPKARKQKKFRFESTTKEQMKPKKIKRLVEPHEPQEFLTLQSLISTASTIKNNTVAAQRLVVVDTACHETTEKKDDEGHLAMLEIREALLRHDWDLALQLLPHLFLKVDCLHFIWQSYLQIFCHHPNTSPEMLRELLQTCLQTSTISKGDLKELFCLRPELDTQEMNGEEHEKLDFKLNPHWSKTASVVHRLSQEPI